MIRDFLLVLLIVSIGLLSYNITIRVKIMETQLEYIHWELKRFNDSIDPNVIRFNLNKKEKKCID